MTRSRHIIIFIYHKILIILLQCDLVDLLDSLFGKFSRGPSPGSFEKGMGRHSRPKHLRSEVKEKKETQKKERKEKVKSIKKYFQVTYIKKIIGIFLFLGSK
jgi:hypothetical protein